MHPGDDPLHDMRTQPSEHVDARLHDMPTRELEGYRAELARMQPSEHVDARIALVDDVLRTRTGHVPSEPAESAAQSFDRVLRLLQAAQRRGGSSAALTERRHRETLERLLERVDETRCERYRRAIS